MSRQKDIQAALELHNQARSKANGARKPDLAWDNSLALDAERWALQMTMSGKFEHSKHPGQGENLYWHSEFATYEMAALSWLEEKPKYNGEALPVEAAGEARERFKDYGHYTQMIWPEATKVEMGFFCCPECDGEWGKGGTYVVARYDQPQIGGMAAWRPSKSNPFGHHGVTNDEGSTWNEE